MSTDSSRDVGGELPVGYMRRNADRNGNPQPGAIEGPAAVCTGSSVNAGDAPGGGTWSSDTYRSSDSRRVFGDRDGH